MPMNAAKLLLLNVLGGGSAPFSPLSIPGLALWLDASDSATLFQDSAGTTPATADNDVVGRMNDKSGGGRHFTQATTPNKPILKLATKSGRSVLRFDGTDDYLQSSVTNILNLASVVTLLAVAYPTSISVKAIFSQIGSSAVAYTNNASFAFEGGAILFSDSTAAPLNTWRVFGVQRAGANAGETRLYVNGVQNDNGVAFPNRDTTYESQLGANGGVIPWAGDIAEALVYHAVLSSDELTQVNAYLNAKWGVY